MGQEWEVNDQPDLKQSTVVPNVWGENWLKHVSNFYQPYSLVFGFGRIPPCKTLRTHTWVVNDQHGVNLDTYSCRDFMTYLAENRKGSMVITAVNDTLENTTWYDCSWDPQRPRMLVKQWRWPIPSKTSFPHWAQRWQLRAKAGFVISTWKMLLKNFYKQWNKNK